MSFTKVAPAGIGTEPGTSIRIGDSLLHSTGIDIGTGTGIGVTIRKHGDATFTGIVSATKFVGSGDISGTTGTFTGTGSVGTTATGILFAVGDGGASGDRVIQFKRATRSTDINIQAINSGSGGTNLLFNQEGGAASFGGNLSVSGNLGVGGVLTYEDVTNVDSVGLITARAGINLIGNDLNVGSNIKIGNASGIITATSYRGDGSQLTGIDATALKSGGSVKVQANSHGAVTTGVHTATAFNGIIVPATYHGGRRNMFINGEFMISQRGNRDPQANQNNGANALGYGGPDHVNFVTNLGAFEAKQVNENSSPRSQAGASYSYELDCTSASGPSTSNYTYLAFHWNGIETNRLLYGTSNARPVTISFWVQCNKTGNFTATLRNETSNKLISSVVTISSSNTWEYKTITFVGDTAAQIAVTINSRWSLELWLDGGSNYTGGTVRTGWTTKDNADRGAGSTLNICSSTSNYFRISLFQVEMGPYATPFEFRTYGEYLHDCEYFFQKPQSSRGSNQAFAIHIWGHKIADTYALRAQSMMRPTEMRINPTDYYHDNNPSGLTAQRYQTQGSDYEYTYGVAMSIGSNKKEFAGGTKYPYGVNGISSAESGILFAYDFESFAEY